MFLAFKKKFWERNDISKEELHDPQHIADNLRHLDARLHSHEGGTPMFLHDVDTHLRDFKGQQHLYLCPRVTPRANWFHRTKKWKLVMHTEAPSILQNPKLESDARAL